MARRTENRSPPRRRSAGQTSPSGPTVDPPRVLVEATDFLDQNTGTLPERITAADLEKLNAGLGFFFSYLRGASGVFYQSADGGRDGAVMALAAAWRFIALFEQPFAENLYLPILHLQDALQKLDEGTVAPMLAKSVRRRGRATSTRARGGLKGYAAGTVKRLVEANVLRREAWVLVSEALGQLGVRPERGSGPITATTVRHWCNDVAADVGRHGAAAIVYDGMFTDEERHRFSDLQSDRERQAHALNSLAGFVRANFPSAENPKFSEPQKPT
jgi:hypothetical protein